MENSQARHSEELTILESHRNGTDSGRKSLQNLRYATGASIPAVPYWPGVNARDPDFQAATAPVSDQWRQDLGYLHGIDLFNHGCYWEAHEAWEHRWLHLPEDQPLRTHLQGLIQASASLLKLRLSQPAPARTIWERGRARLITLADQIPEKIYWGIEIPPLIEIIDGLVSAEDQQFVTPRIVLIGWP